MSGHQCPFCDRDPYHYVDNGVGMVAVAVNCCNLACAAYDYRERDDEEVTLTAKELRDIAYRITGLQREVDRRNQLIERLYKRRHGKNFGSVIDYCTICGGQLTWQHDHKPDQSGLDDGPPLRHERKKYARPSSEAAREARARAWATRREKLGPKGHR